MPSAPDTLALELEERVSRLWWLLSRAAPTALSRTAGASLARLREDGPQRIGALAAAESVTQPTITCVVQRLEREGMVEREPDPLDARAVRISITDAGLEALDARSFLRAEVLDARLRHLDAAQRRALVAALGAIDELLAADAEPTAAATATDAAAADATPSPSPSPTIPTESPR